MSGPKGITQQEYEDASRHGYTEIKPDGTPYLLYMDDDGATVWGPVVIDPTWDETPGTAPYGPDGHTISEADHMRAWDNQ